MSDKDQAGADILLSLSCQYKMHSAFDVMVAGGGGRLSHISDPASKARHTDGMHVSIRRSGPLSHISDSISSRDSSERLSCPEICQITQETTYCNVFFSQLDVFLLHVENTKVVLTLIHPLPPAVTSFSNK